VPSAPIETSSPCLASMAAGAAMVTDTSKL
jgi:hypothetical protein